MSTESAGQKERSIAQTIQTQFKFYIISLTFTLLAASIQTAKFHHSNFEDITEIVSWFLLLASGLVSLWVVEWEPTIRAQIALQNDIGDRIADVKTARLRGTQQIHVLKDDSTQSIQDQLVNLEQSSAKVRERIDKHEKLGFKKYDFAKYTFIIGLTLLVVSRASAALVSIFGYSLL